MEKRENIRIVDIAKMAKVSVGTVDRVLHNRGRVSEEKRKKVEDVLKKIDYKPNMVARFLASKRTFSFAVIIPSYQSGEYWELVSSGIDKAIKELSDFHVDVDYLFFDQFDSSSFDKTKDRLWTNDYAGVIMATLLREKVVDLSRELDERKIPYVFIDSDLPGCKNLSYFGANSYVSGAIAAKLMLFSISIDENILIGDAKYKHNILSTQIENREQGFRDYLKKHGFKGEIISFVFNPNQQEKYAQQLEDIFKKTKGRIGAIVFNSRIYELVDLMDKVENKDNVVKMIGYDPISRNVKALKDDKISHLISQRSVQQGSESVKALSNHLIFNSNLEENNYMPIDILIKENIDFYHD